MSDQIPEPPPTKRTTLKTSRRVATNVAPSQYRVTQPILEKITAAKMDGTWTCELTNVEFNFLTANEKDLKGNLTNDFVFENVHVFREGWTDKVLDARERTAEDAIAEEEEISRLRRLEQENKKPGRLARANFHEGEYHPRKKPDGAA